MYLGASSPDEVESERKMSGGSADDCGGANCSDEENSEREDSGHNPFNQNSDRSDREKWTTSKGGPVFTKLFRLDQTDPSSFGPKFPDILVEWIAPVTDTTRASKVRVESAKKWTKCIILATCSVEHFGQTDFAERMISVHVFLEATLH